MTATPLRRVAVVALLLAGAAAPTAGDLGGCGQEAVLLDEAKFFAAKARLDCTRCQDCSLVSRACTLACDGGDPEASFPEDCAPLVHDGEVCLRALADGDCDAYASWVADRYATVPTECAFCPER